jgi:5,10-methylenetetrahydromethanopterin reductase
LHAGEIGGSFNLAMQIDLILEPDCRPAQIAELAGMAEDYGVRTLWASNYSSARDVFMSLVPTATATSRLGIGVLVVSPWEMHPLKIANALLTLNEYCDGRAQIVISGGGEWCGVMGSGHARRVRAVRETIELIKAAATGEMLNFDGELYKAWGFDAAWAQQPPPSVYAGASKRQMFRMGATFADGAMMSDVPPLPILDESVGIIRARLAEVGREDEAFRISNFWAWHVKADRETSLREARREMILRGWLVRYHLEPFMTSEEIDLVEENKAAFLNAYNDRSGDIKGVPPEIVDKLIENFTFSGDPGDIDRHVETLRRFEQAGLTEIALRLHDDPADAIRLIGARVMPAFR